MNLRTSKYDRVIRRFVPSLSRLTYYSTVKLFLSFFDFPGRLMFSELRGIPPNYMRVRVGVSNRVFSNGIQYLTAAQNFWMYCIEKKIIDFDSSIIDVGCGCGRFAHILRDCSFLGSRFNGNYIGIDIDSELLDWCRKNFDSERFSFVHSTHDSKSYVNSQAASCYVLLPAADSKADLVFSTSLFSHLLEYELINYVQESARVLRPGGVMMMSVFCLDYPPPTLGNRHTFKHKIGNAHVESLAQPEAAVAYSEEFLLKLCKEAGFSKVEILTAPGLWQPRLTATK
jgi:SAM-dependent methyltransferase